MSIRTPRIAAIQSRAHGIPRSLLSIERLASALYTLKRYVALGLGVAVTSELSITEEDRLQLDVVTVPPALKADTTVGVVLRRDKHRGPLLKDLLEMLSTIAGSRA